MIYQEYQPVKILHLKINPIRLIRKGWIVQVAPGWDNILALWEPMGFDGYFARNCDNKVL